MASAKCLDCGAWFRISPEEATAIFADGERGKDPDVNLGIGQGP